MLHWLVTRSIWQIAKDSLPDPQRLPLNYDSFLNQGHQFVSFEKKNNLTPGHWQNINNIEAQHLNYYMIFAWQTVMEKLGEDTCKHDIGRIFWNYYDSKAQPYPHRDVQNLECLSMVFDLESGKGSTKIGEYTFVDEVGQVKVFNSSQLHHGIVYDNKVRFNCNIVSFRNG